MMPFRSPPCPHTLPSHHTPAAAAAAASSTASSVLSHWYSLVCLRQLRGLPHFRPSGPLICCRLGRLVKSPYAHPPYYTLAAASPLGTAQCALGSFVTFPMAMVLPSSLSVNLPMAGSCSKVSMQMGRSRLMRQMHIAPLLTNLACETEKEASVKKGVLKHTPTPAFV